MLDRKTQYDYLDTLDVNDRVKVNILTVGAVPFISKGPLTGIDLKAGAVRALIALGHPVEIDALDQGGQYGALPERRLRDSFVVEKKKKPTGKASSPSTIAAETALAEDALATSVKLADTARESAEVARVKASVAAAAVEVAEVKLATKTVINEERSKVDEADNAKKADINAKKKAAADTQSAIDAEVAEIGRLIEINAAEATKVSNELKTAKARAESEARRVETIKSEIRDMDSVAKELKEQAAGEMTKKETITVNRKEKNNAAGLVTAKDSLALSQAELSRLNAAVKTLMSDSAKVASALKSDRYRIEELKKG